MFLAIRELLYAKFRYVLIGLIMVLITLLIFIISGLAQGLSADNASAIQDLKADYILIDPDAELEMTKSFIPHEAHEEVAEIDGVKEAAPLSIRMMNAAVNNTEQNEDVALFVTEADGMLMPSVSEGEKIESQNEVIVDDSLKREGVKIGDTLEFGENSVFTIAGFTENQRYSHTSVVYMDGGESENINAVTIQADEANIDEIRNKLGSTYDVVTKDEALQGIPSYSQEQGSLNMMIIFMFVIAAFVLAAFFYVITLQKRDQFGVLKALGAKTSYLLKNLVSQVVLISFVCIVAAIGLTLGVEALLPEDMPFLLTADEMLQTSILILIVSIIGALVSLFQVVKIDPVEAIEGAGK
ncbi:ABC transporter permease [Lentibacillus amyloliquefaciens]|uniref:Putative hemin transport system permease protein HrtB n=1 Tax=Lentibacillus amyloliquefaciens TaxID=1472767 RepID=A0A0U3W6M1_9BACI|nr:ABC transporter permease [Lentibacillus amyloliquefaciens]ALX48832.1 ABC transporter permease [Lentibacillus amyloliquefaciens]